PPERCYTIVDGRARVVRQDEDGTETSLNMLEAGDVFGERALLEGGERTATIRAASELTVMRLHRSGFWAIVRLGTDASDWAATQARGHRLRDVLRRRPAFTGAEPELFTELATATSEEDVEPGDSIVRAGEPVSQVTV